VRQWNKVFGIGLPKTGTSSLHAFLNANGIASLHFGSSGADEIRDKLYRGIYRFDALEKYDALTNCAENYFAQLDKEYPNSRFILTTRDKDSWLVSIEKHWAKMIRNIGEARAMRIDNHLITFGCYLFNKDRFAYVYDTTHAMVRDYFKDRDDCFTLSLENKDVAGLRDFLGLSGNITFPHTNKG
jgi:hypothetical protein